MDDVIKRMDIIAIIIMIVNLSQKLWDQRRFLGVARGATAPL